ncbi:MAG: hypothetical protein ACRENG_17730 [bacterium]
MRKAGKACKNTSHNIEPGFPALLRDVEYPQRSQAANRYCHIRHCHTRKFEKRNAAACFIGEHAEKNF